MHIRGTVMNHKKQQDHQVSVTNKIYTICGISSSSYITSHLPFGGFLGSNTSRLDESLSLFIPEEFNKTIPLFDVLLQVLL